LAPLAAAPLACNYLGSSQGNNPNDHHLREKHPRRGQGLRASTSTPAATGTLQTAGNGSLFLVGHTINCCLSIANDLMTAYNLILGLYSRFALRCMEKFYRERSSQINLASARP